MAEEHTNERTLKRVRSPNYPSMSLVEAVQQVQKLFGKIGQHPAPRDAVATSMGYSGLHGASATAISALIKYGLLERVGEDYKLTERAMRIIAPHNQGEKTNALQEASQEPALFAELMDHFKGDVPIDDLLRSYLLRKGFAQAAVPSVIAAYRETMELVDHESGEYHSQPKADERMLETSHLLSNPSSSGGLKPMEGERVVFTHEIEPAHLVRILVSGEVDDSVLNALELYIQLHKQLEQGRKATKQPE